MRNNTFLSAAVLCLIAGCGAGDSTNQAMELGSQVDLRCVILQESLGVTLKIGGDYGAMQLDLINKGPQELSVGSDVYLAFEGSEDAGALVLSGAGRSDKDDRSLMFASESDLFSGVEDTKLVKYIDRAGGQAFKMDPGAIGDYKGTWPTALPAAGRASIGQQLLTWPKTERGWVATPALQPAGSKSVSFRLIGKLGETADKPIVVPVTASSLAKFIRDGKQPLVARKWAVGWLVTLDGDAGWQAASNLLSDKQTPIDIRKAAARWLATQSSAKALDSVDSVLWDVTTPEELQLTCYYALTWSQHAEAKPLIKKAGTHANKKIQESVSKAASQ